MIDLSVVLWTLFAIGAIAYATIYMRVRRLLLQTAQDIVNEDRQRRDDRPNLVQINPSEFPWADHAFYDRSEAELAEMGFRKLCDVEDGKETRISPHLRRFGRSMRSADGKVLAHISQISFLPEHAPEAWKNAQIDDRFILTLASVSATHDCVETVRSDEHHPAIELAKCTVRFVSTDSTAVQLLATHRESMDSVTRSNPQIQWLTVGSYEDLVARADLLHELARASGLYDRINAIAQLEQSDNTGTRMLLKYVRKLQQRQR